MSLILVLHVAVGALDLGLTSTVTREVARAKDDANVDLIRLMGSLWAIYWLMSVVLGIALYWSAEGIILLLGPAKSIPTQEVILAIQLIAAYLAIRWPVAFYSGILVGKQQLGILNALKSGSLTLRWLGGHF